MQLLELKPVYWCTLVCVKDFVFVNLRCHENGFHYYTQFVSCLDLFVQTGVVALFV